MDEKAMQQNENTPQEVVLHYTREREVVHYYVHPRPLPGKKGEEKKPVLPARKRNRTGLYIFLAFFTLVLISAGVSLAVFWDDIEWSLEYGGHRDDYEAPGFEYSDGRYYDLPTITKAPALGDARIDYVPQGGTELTPSEVFERVSPSVVTVIAELEDPMSTSIGTGVIMSTDGYIVTNFHILSGAQSCFVALYTGDTYSARLVGYGTREDLAVLKIEALGLTPAEFGDSDTLKVGEAVYAIGNPLGVELLATFTDGIVSALGRELPEDVSIPLIQTNVALNSGNSGGPLINRYGQVVGINTMKMARDHQNEYTVEGLGFAIPIATCAYMVNDIIAVGEIRGEVVIGISVLKKQVTLPDGTLALEIDAVDEDSPAEKAGLRKGDYLVSADGEKLEQTTDLLRIRRRHTAGEELLLTICRDGEYLDIPVVLEEKK